MIVDGKPATNSWWDLGDQARNAGHEQSPGLVQSDISDDVTLYRITLRNSPNFHASFRRGAGLTVWAVRIDTPKSARNTIGIDLAQATNITVTQSSIRTGDDDIAISAGNGPATASPSSTTISTGATASPLAARPTAESAASASKTSRSTRPTTASASPPILHTAALSRMSSTAMSASATPKIPIVFDTAFSFPGKGVELAPVYQRHHASRHAHLRRRQGPVQWLRQHPPHRRHAGRCVHAGRAGEIKAQANHTDLTFGPAPSTSPSPATTPPSPARKSTASSPAALPNSFPSPRHSCPRSCLPQPRRYILWDGFAEQTDASAHRRRFRSHAEDRGERPASGRAGNSRDSDGGRRQGGSCHA